MKELALTAQSGTPDALPIRFHIEDFDVLRGLAIIMIFIGNVPFNLFAWHSSLGVFEDEFWNGSAGVDLFFAIAGFTVARTLLPRGFRPGPPSGLRRAARFLVRRFWRRTVLAWMWIAIPLALSAVFNESHAFHSVRANLAFGVAALLDVNNIWLAQVFGSDESGVLFPYWAVSLGTQFAIGLPLLAAVCGRTLPIVLAGLLAYTFVMPHEALCFYTRPGPLALGALLAVASGHRDYRLGTPHFFGGGAVVRAGTLALMVLVLGTLQSSLLRPLVSIPFGLAALAAGALVYAASFDAGYIAGTGPLRRAGAWLGRGSYAIYLTHVPAFALTRELYARFRPPMWIPTAQQAEHLLIVAGALTALASEASYRLVQRPGKRHADRFRNESFGAQ